MHLARILPKERVLRGVYIIMVCSECGAESCMHIISNRQAECRRRTEAIAAAAQRHLDTGRILVIAEKPVTDAEAVGIHRRREPEGYR